MVGLTPSVPVPTVRRKDPGLSLHRNIGCISHYGPTRVSLVCTSSISLRYVSRRVSTEPLPDSCSKLLYLTPKTSK